MITVGIISMGCQHREEDICSTICTEISSKFLESMCLLGPSAVGLMASSGIHRDNSLLCLLEFKLLNLLGLQLLEHWTLWSILVSTCLFIYGGLSVDGSKFDNLLLNVIY